MNNEPSLHDMDDFDNNESPEKRKLVRLIILGLILMSAFYGGVKYYFSSVSDKIDTSSRPAVLE